MRDLWFAIGRDGNEWCFDLFYVGSYRIPDGAVRVTEFARWLLTPQATGRYEKRFDLIDRAKAPTLDDGNSTVDVTVWLGREEVGGPEYLIVDASLRLQRGGALLPCPECKMVDRGRLERAASALLKPEMS